MPLDPFYYTGAGDTAAAMLWEKAKASNISAGANPGYSSSDFLALFPQFKTVCTVTGSGTDSAVPQALLTNLISRANASLAYGRYQENWEYCMGLFIAHFIVLYLKTATQTTAAGLISAAQPNLIQSSKSVDSVSVSYDTGSMSDYDGWGQFKTTTYGQQLITYMKMAGMGGMLV
jgi:hypothetical protein